GGGAGFPSGFLGSTFPVSGFFASAFFTSGSSFPVSTGGVGFSFASSFSSVGSGFWASSGPFSALSFFQNRRGITRELGWRVISVVFPSSFRGMGPRGDGPKYRRRGVPSTGGERGFRAARGRHLEDPGGLASHLRGRGRTAERGPKTLDPNPLRDLSRGPRGHEGEASPAHARVSAWARSGRGLAPRGRGARRRDGGGLRSTGTSRGDRL